MRSIVWVTPCIEPAPSTTSATRPGSPSRVASFAISLPSIVVAGTYGIAGTQASNSPLAASPYPSRAAAAAVTRSTASRMRAHGFAAPAGRGRGG